MRITLPFINTQNEGSQSTNQNHLQIWDTSSVDSGVPLCTFSTHITPQSTATQSPHITPQRSATMKTSASMSRSNYAGLKSRE